MLAAPQCNKELTCGHQLQWCACNGVAPLAAIAGEGRAKLDRAGRCRTGQGRAEQGRVVQAF